MRAINDWVFIKRDKQKEDYEGLAVSEKAQIKNMVGEVAFVSEGQPVSVGQRVHLPHFQVMEAEIDGVEYAVVKSDKLFAVEKNGVFVPINGYVKVIKCVNDHERDEDGDVNFYQTDNFLEKTNFVEILAVADDCVCAEEGHIREFCEAPENNERLQRLLYSKEYMVHEDLIEFTTPGE